MSRETFAATTERVRRHCDRSGQREVVFALHGGEPTLVGVERFAWMCGHLRERLEPQTEVRIKLQTNGTRLSAEWAAVFREHDVAVGVSLDGPAEVNDANRVTHRGGGSHDAVLRGIEHLRAAVVPFGILTVVVPGADPLGVHHHFVGLGCESVSYLLPALTHDTAGSVHERFGRTPCADYLIPIFDDWWFQRSRDLLRIVLGGSSRSEMIGNSPLRFVGIETDGSIQGLDKLQVCEDGMRGIGDLNVHTVDFIELASASALHAEIMQGLPLPSGCRSCPERTTCAGGHAPNRYSRERGFDNPSVWCADLLALLAHVRLRTGISVEETASRRRHLTAQRDEAHHVAV
jgi:uncharacterized protein